MFFESKEDDFEALNRLIENQTYKNEESNFDSGNELRFLGIQPFRTPFENSDPSLPPGLFRPIVQDPVNNSSGNIPIETEEDEQETFSAFGSFFNIPFSEDLKRKNRERTQENKKEIPQRYLRKINLKSDPYVPIQLQRETPGQTPTETPTDNQREPQNEHNPTETPEIERDASPEEKQIENNPEPIVKEYKVLSKKEIERNRLKNASKNQKSEDKKPEPKNNPQAKEVKKNQETSAHEYKKEEKDNENEKDTARRSSFHKKPFNKSSKEKVDENNTKTNYHRKRDSLEMVNQQIPAENQSQTHKKSKNKNQHQSQNSQQNLNPKPAEFVQTRKKSPPQEEPNPVLLLKTRNPANDNPFDQGNLFIKLAESSSSTESASENSNIDENIEEKKELDEIKPSPKELAQKENQGNKTPQANLTKNQKKKQKKKAEQEEKEKLGLAMTKEKKDVPITPEKEKVKKEIATEGEKKLEQLVKHETEEDKRETKASSTPKNEASSSKEDEEINQDAVPAKSKKKKRKKKAKGKKEEEAKFVVSDESRENEEYDHLLPQENSNILQWPEPNLYNSLFQSMIISTLTREPEKK